MNPDPRERLPREIFEELMEEGAEAFRNVLEKLLNLAMELERSEFLGAEPYERTSRRRDHANGFKDKTVATRVGRLKLKIPQAPVVLPEVLGARMPVGESPEAGHCRDVRERSLDPQGQPDHGAAVWDRDLGQPGLEDCPAAGRGAGAVPGTGVGGIPGGLLGCPLREGAGQWHGAGPGHPESDWSELLGETRSPGGLGGA